jgi:hypothetical protein
VGGSVSTGAGGGSSGGASGSGGSGGAGGGSGGSAAGSGGASGSGGSGGAPPLICHPWPSPGETVELDATQEIDGVFDGSFKRYDGIHCDGTCRLENVWWQDVGEDAATLDGESSTQVMTIECAGAKGASDKVFQHNGPGTMVLRDVFVEDFGKLYRSCGNCLEQYTRHVSLENIDAAEGDLLVGLNENYDDTADFSNVTVHGDITICGRYIGNDTGEEPSFVDEGADSEHCRYEPSDIHEE